MTSDTLEICRSLIQKALRRADLDITRCAAAYLIESGDFEWLRNRLAVLAFEECWTYGLQISYENDEKIVVDELLKIAGTIKNRNATGLGSLAYVLSQGDESVFNADASDEDIRFIAGAIIKPAEFWRWTRSQALDRKQKTLCENACLAFEKAEETWDKAFTQAATYLAITDNIPETRFAKATTQNDFPLWIAIDKHTRIGQAAITEAARQIGLNPAKALWLAFYFEGVTCNEIAFSPWWERERLWRMKNLGLTMDEGRQWYDKLRPVLIELLKGETEKLRDAIF